VLGIALLVGLIVWAAQAAGARELVERVVLRLRGMGAAVFFSAMALLPALGFPLLPFALAAGPVFAPTLGTGGVVACAILAVAINVTLTYALASTGLRPLVAKLMARLGYRLPPPRPDRTWFFITIVRLAPGLPFWAQGYLLGLMRVPFAPYVVVSTLVPAGYLTAAIVFGDALMHGDRRVAFTALAAIVIISVAVFLIRRRMHARAHPTPASTNT